MIVTYELLKKKPQTQTSGFRKPFAATFSLPTISRVHFQDEETGRTYVRKVRYCPMEESIFMDEQPIDSKAECITFENGRYDVNPVNDPNLYQILEILDSNSSKVNRNDAKTPVYHRYDPSAEARKRLIKEQDNEQKMRLFWEMEDEQLEAVAGLWGIKTSKKKSLWRADVYDKAKANVDKFIELAGDDSLNVLVKINKAKKFDLITFTNRRWKFGTTKLLDVSVGGNPSSELIKWLKLNPATLDAINLEAEKYILKLRGEETVANATDAYTAAETLEMGMKSKVVKYKKGKGWMFTEHYEGLGDDDQIFGTGEGSRNAKAIAIEFIADNAAVKKEILVRREVKLEEEKLGADK